MKKWLRWLCSAFCFMNIALPGNVLADEQLDLAEDSAEQNVQQEKEYLLTCMTDDVGLQSLSLQEGPSLNALHLYLGDASGRIIKDAQVVTTIIDAGGHQQSSRATPYKCGYFVAIDQLPAGRYRVETEVVTNAQLWTDEFIFDKV